MKKTSGKLLSAALALLLALALCVPALAEDAAPDDGLATRGDVVKWIYTDLALDKTDLSAEITFTDVSADGGVAEAAAWAAKYDIVKGYGDGRFGPDDLVTREQLATMFYRVARHQGQGFRGAWMFLLDAPDAAEVSDWADEAMHWAVMNDIILGTERGLEPKATATEEQLEEVLLRWLVTVDDPTADEDPYIGKFTGEDGSTLEIGLTENATHSVSLSIVRLASFDDGEGVMSDGGLSFMATDPNGNPIYGMISFDDEDLDQNTLTVAITESTWELLPDGTEFSFTRIIL
jgi:hypothetical protein